MVRQLWIAVHGVGSTIFLETKIRVRFMATLSVATFGILISISVTPRLNCCLHCSCPCCVFSLFGLCGVSIMIMVSCV